LSTLILAPGAPGAQKPAACALCRGAIKIEQQILISGMLRRDGSFLGDGRVILHLDCAQRYAATVPSGPRVS